MDSKVAVSCADLYRVARLQVVGDHRLCDQRLHLALEISLERPRAVNGIVAVFDDEIFRERGDHQLQLFVFQPCGKILYQQVDDLRDILFGERFVVDDLVQPVENSGLKLCLRSCETFSFASSEISPFSSMPSSR